MSIYAPSAEGFQSLLRIAGSSIANPPWFAVPVDAEEDSDSITVVFHVPEKSHGRVRVQASDQTITVWGRSGSMRLCALPCSIVTTGVETACSGDLLRVSILKKRPATDSTDAASSSTSTSST
jgi:HSP20 family molecular chaperone IbpA